MRSAGSRHSKNFDLGERLERYREGIEFDPRAVAGKWLETHGTGCRSVQVDLGCGKGAFTIDATGIFSSSVSTMNRSASYTPHRRRSNASCRT